MWSLLPLAVAESAVLPRTTDPTAIWVAAIGALSLIVVAFIGTLRNRPSPAAPPPPTDTLTPSERTVLAVLEVNVATIHGDLAATDRAVAELTTRFNRHIEQQSGGGVS